MTDVFVLRNQHNEFLTKSLEWLAAGDSKTLYRSIHRDEVINEKVEVTVKRPDLRIEVVIAEQANNGKILIDGDECIPKTRELTQLEEDKVTSGASSAIPDLSDEGTDSSNAPEEATEIGITN